MNTWDKLRELAALGRWCFLDLETTGLDAPVDVVQLGLDIGRTDAHGVWRDGVQLSVVVEPTLPIQPSALAVHGLDPARLAAGRDCTDLHGVRVAEGSGQVLLERVVDWRTAVELTEVVLAELRPAVIFTWSTFDTDVLDGLIARGRPCLDLSPFEIVDLRALYAATLPTPEGGARESTRLASAARRLCVTAEPQAHRALPDAMLARGVALRLLAEAPFAVALAKRARTADPARGAA
jgi:DNA polymerase III epsilon subunit-like protein